MELPPAIKMLPSSQHIQGNTTRVQWIQSFVNTVSVQAHPEKMSLEDKIERLQRRLGGQPLRFEEQMSRVVERESRDQEEKLMQQFQ